MVDQTFTINLGGNDGEDDSNTSTVTMTVRAIQNARPTVTIQTAAQTLPGGTVLQLQATATDPDGDALTLAWSAAPNLGTYDDDTIEDAEYTLPAGVLSNRPIVLSLRAEDSGGLNHTATVTITVEALDPPTIDTIPEHANEVVRALITLDDFTEGDSVQENWFRIASSLGSVSADSDMLIAANLTLDRMRWRSSDQRVTLNRSGSGTMSSYFGTGNPGHTQFIFIAVADLEDHIAEIDIDAEFGTANSPLAATGHNTRCGSGTAEPRAAGRRYQPRHWR